MKLIISGEQIVATALDEYEPNGSETAVLVAPKEFNPDMIALYRWVNGQLIESVPVSVSPLQIRKALRQIGLNNAVMEFIKTAPVEVQEAWEYAIEIRRDDPFILAAAVSLQQSEAQIDNLFRLASTL